MENYDVYNIVMAFVLLGGYPPFRRILSVRKTVKNCSNSLTVVCAMSKIGRILSRDFVEIKEFYFDLNVKLNLSSLSLRWAELIL